VLEGLASRPDQNERRALSAMYLLHELVHVAQRLVSKQMMLEVRAAGAETTLQHLDLAADHAAACLAHDAVPRWKLSWLKELQGSSLTAYPVGPFHTLGSRARKALRLVSLRLDFLAREGRWLLAKEAGDAYLFVDHGPAGGQLLALAGTPPFPVLRCVGLSAEDAALLTSAADEDGGDDAISKVDALLVRLFGSKT
jgi:hypothetical protein